jgi:Flp pilus assembly pilin Flp
MSVIKIFRVLTALISVVGIIFGVTIVSGNVDQAGNMLYLAYAVLAIILVSVVLFTLINTLSNKHALKSTLTGLGSFLLVAVISYVLADGNSTVDRNGVEILSENGTKMVNTGLYLFYALAVIAAVSIVFSGIKSSFSNK